MTITKIGFFTRVLDDAPPAERYRLALAQIERAEHAGFDAVWVAQHHFSAREGGLPSPLVFLAHAAARTSRVRLGTGIITLPVEQPVRVAEDASVLDALSGGRVELGFGSGGTPSSFPAFGTTFDDRRTVYDAHLAAVTEALRGGDVAGTGNRLYPAAAPLADRLWEATFSARGGRGRRCARQRAAALAHPAGDARDRRPEPLRHPEPHHRCVSRRASRRRRAPHPRLPHGLRRRLDGRGPAVGPARPAEVPQGLRRAGPARRGRRPRRPDPARATAISAHRTRSPRRWPPTRRWSARPRSRSRCTRSTRRTS